MTQFVNLHRENYAWGFSYHGLLFNVQTKKIRVYKVENEKSIPNHLPTIWDKICFRYKISTPSQTLVFAAQDKLQIDHWLKNDYVRPGHLNSKQVMSDYGVERIYVANRKEQILVSQYGDQTYDPTTECMQQLSNFLRSLYFGQATFVFNVKFPDSKKCPLHDKKKSQCFDQPFELEGPAASSPPEWLWPVLKKEKIPFQDFPTDGDYYRFSIGSNKNGIKMTMDWKHLDVGEVERINVRLEPFGVYIQHDGDKDGFITRVQLCAF